MAIAAGFRFLHYGVTGPAGYMIGNTLAGASQGQLQALTRLEGARTMPVNIPETETLTVSGDDQPLVQFQFDAEDLASGVFQMAVRDASFEALIQGTAVESLAGSSVGVLQPDNPAPPDMVLVAQRNSKKWAAGVRGVKAWEITIIPKVQITPLYTTIEQRTFQPYQYKYTSSKADTKPWGATFTEALNGAQQGAAIVVDSDYPIDIAAIQGNGSTTSFALPFAPVSASYMAVFVGQLQKYVTTHWTISGNTITFLAAPGAGVYAHVYFGVDPAVFA